MKTLFFTFLLATLLFGCQDDKLGDSDSAVETQKINRFLESSMKDIYYWADEIKSKNPDKSKDPVVYFSDLKYSNDRWSYLTEENQDQGDILAAEDGFDNGFGYNVTFWTVNGNPNQEVRINFVYPGSPAAEAGLERGDIINRLDGEPITNNNRDRILNGNTIKIDVDKWNEGNQSYTLTARRFDIDPILLAKVLVTNDGKKVGYLCYTKFTAKAGVPNTRWKEDPYLKKMTETCEKLKNEGITELILDLRYNGGGYSTAAVQLASLLCPIETARAGSILIKEQWNDKYADHQTTLPLYRDIPAEANLDLSHLYVLTNQATASASEVVISGLKPYMNQIITIGDRTVGKNMGGQTLTPTDSELKHWHAYLIMFTYTNSRDESIADGIFPTLSIKNEVDYANRFPLGSIQDPHIAAALRHITGETLLTSLSKSTAIDTCIPEYPNMRHRFISD